MLGMNASTDAVPRRTPIVFTVPLENHNTIDMNLLQTRRRLNQNYYKSQLYDYICIICHLIYLFLIAQSMSVLRLVPAFSDFNAADRDLTI